VRRAVRSGAPLLAVCLGCAPALQVPPRQQAALAPTAVVAQDSSPKEDVRMLPAEVYLRTYLDLFGGAPPLEVQRRARGGGLFDSWNDYAAALGLPDHRNDLPRASQSNALMVATIDRLAIALCVRAAEHDLRGGLPPGQRLIFAFPGAPQPASRADFAGPFDVLHRTFLGYPAALAPPGRTEAFFALFRSTAARHQAGPLSAVEAGWVSVCLGLARHPEFSTY
jgi:hypothetical protein